MHKPLSMVKNPGFSGAKAPDHAFSYRRPASKPVKMNTNLGRKTPDWTALSAVLLRIRGVGALPPAWTSMIRCLSQPAILLAVPTILHEVDLLALGYRLCVLPCCTLLPKVLISSSIPVRLRVYAFSYVVAVTSPVNGDVFVPFVEIYDILGPVHQGRCDLGA